MRGLVLASPVFCQGNGVIISPVEVWFIPVRGVADSSEAQEASKKGHAASSGSKIEWVMLFTISLSNWMDRAEA